MLFKSFAFLTFLLSICEGGKIKVHEPDESNLEKPCKVQDLKCVSKYFWTHGWCLGSKMLSKPNEKLNIKKQESEMPSYNVTNSMENIVYTGLEKGKIKEFHYNKKSGITLFLIEFNNFEIDTGKAQFIYHRAGKEDLVITTNLHEEYDSVEVNTLIDRSGMWNCKSHAFIPNIPKFTLGEGLDDIKNEDVHKLYNAFFTSPGQAVQEVYYLRAYDLAKYYVQTVICNPKYLHHF